MFKGISSSIHGESWAYACALHNDWALQNITFCNPDSWSLKLAAAEMQNLFLQGAQTVDFMSMDRSDNYSSQQSFDVYMQKKWTWCFFCDWTLTYLMTPKHL